MKLTANTFWKNKMSFEAQIDDHKIIIDASNENGGENKGPRPKALLMVSLAGCTGMDVVSILSKMRVVFDSFNIVTEGDTLNEHPKAYHTIKMIYEFTGTNLPIDKVRKAISLSIEKYCGVNATLIKAIKIEYEIKINGKTFGLSE